MAVRRLRTRGRVVIALLAIIAGMGASVVTAHAAGQNWSGRFTVVTYASQKAGTSAAARQAEPDFSAQYTFLTQCSSRCVATALDGPAPSNPTIPNRPATPGTVVSGRLPTTGNGSATTARAPAAVQPGPVLGVLHPQADGSLQGTWHTDILSGRAAAT